MGVLHGLVLPLPKMPTFLFKTMAKFLQQLTGAREPPSRRLPSVHHGNGTTGSTASTESCLPDDVLINNPPPGSLTISQLFGSTSSIGSIHEPQAHLFKFVNDWKLVKEFEWLRTTFFGNLERFPVRFCHNDIQENNLLLYKDPSRQGWYRLLTIDYEYCSYNFRCIDVGNFFNEWTYNNNFPHAPGFLYLPDAYPSREVQLSFWRKYLSVYKHGLNSPVTPGTYIQNRRFHSRSVCGPPPLEVATLLKSPPSAPNINGDDEDYLGDQPDYSLQRLSELEEIQAIEEVELSPEEEEALLIETTYGALISHIWWSLWGLIQSEISSIDFGFIEYATSRMTAYYKMKSTLPPSEFPNGQVPVFDIPGSIPNGETSAKADSQDVQARPVNSGGFYVTTED
uniref:Choline/ethanolamine kinase n=1 Tax=Mesocestoides corti TaxID=53468 RepID=A0A5K3F2W0_MESCO